MAIVFFDKLTERGPRPAIKQLNALDGTGAFMVLFWAENLAAWVTVPSCEEKGERK